MCSLFLCPPSHSLWVTVTRCWTWSSWVKTTATSWWPPTAPSWRCLSCSPTTARSCTDTQVSHQQRAACVCTIYCIPTCETHGSMFFCSPEATKFPHRGNKILKISNQSFFLLWCQKGYLTSYRYITALVVLKKGQGNCSKLPVVIYYRRNNNK